jgi:hypothetical protein
MKLTEYEEPDQRQCPQVSLAPASAVDAGDSLAGFGPHTSARYQSVIESLTLKRARAAAGFVARRLRL